MSITTHVRTIHVNGIDVFYREAGKDEAPVLLLLHGFPSSSFQYRNLIPRLATKYRVIAPDLPGFGFTNVPKIEIDKPAHEALDFVYTFENLAKTIISFTYALKLEKFGIYIFDYGAPTGLRLALARPDAITAIISQNGNAFKEGLGDFWDPIKRYWADPSPANRDLIKFLVTPEVTKSQYTYGESELGAIAPETWTLDQALLDRPGNADIQLDLFLDYKTNVELYPVFHDYFRKYQPPLLAVWGKNDNIFIPEGAKKFKTVLPNAVVHLVDGGHFALENHLDEISSAIFSFLEKV
ncbi:Alpha/Beta hydrolase protein [Crucibulum laeve]|uniref:Alpha/Beta hydrolase protein n=1 Tax=Crucibulum laeve TaxID=68775 RepID=A0A5C3M9L1_9AGAR|nr:Alpha/Beta hydrolase protein [Crucibulum laeve]